MILALHHDDFGKCIFSCLFLLVGARIALARLRPSRP